MTKDKTDSGEYPALRFTVSVMGVKPLLLLGQYTNASGQTINTGLSVLSGQDKRSITISGSFLS
ncbi:hypothetical protein [Yersinia aldovae]|uniref:hypothetical protein n=1 Tax=Yersinia aldovae TaxID=29483 RepID=UPI0011A20E00|nr:hypothetical protein [Yersinia aldovae]